MYVPIALCLIVIIAHLKWNSKEIIRNTELSNRINKRIYH